MLLDLPDELLLLAAQLTLVHNDLPGLLRLTQACSGLRQKLAQVRMQAEARRVCWVAMRPTDRPTPSFHVFDEGRTLRQLIPSTNCAMAGVLPAARRCSWIIRIEHSETIHFGVGCMRVGVCDTEAGASWALDAYDGCMRRGHFDDELNDWIYAVEPEDDPEPPAGFPDSHFTQVLPGAIAGQPADFNRLMGHDADLNGTMLEVIVEEGGLSFRLNDETPNVALNKGSFPAGARLRPFVCVRFAAGACVRMVRGFVDLA